MISKMKILEAELDEKIVYCRDCEIWEACSHEVGKWLGCCFESYKEKIKSEITKKGDEVNVK